MSNVTSLLLECNDPQVELDRYHTTCGHTGHRESPFTQFVMSAENRSGIENIVMPGGGKVRNVIQRYDQKIQASSLTAVTSCDLVCTSDNIVGDLSRTLAFDECEGVEYSEGYKVQDLARICRSNPDFIFGRINAMAMAVEAAVATQFAEDAVSLIGAWASDVAGVSGNVLQVRTLVSISTDQLFSRFPSKINLAAKKTGYCMPTGIFGSSELWEAWDNLNVGCCADSGIDLFAMLQRYNRSVSWDPYVVAALNDDDRNALMTQLGAIQPVFTNIELEANWEFIATPRASNFEVFAMSTPRYGIPFTLTVSNQCGALSLHVRTNPHLVAAPLDMFPIDDPQEGVNFVNELQVTNT